MEMTDIAMRIVREPDRQLEQEFRERSGVLMKEILQNPIPDWDVSRRRMYYAITRLGLGIEGETAFGHLAAVNANPGHDAMFFRHANIDAWLRFGHLYPAALRDCVRISMTNPELYRMEGGTENHKIMNAVSGYLSAQCWPDWMDASEVMERCAGYLQAYFARVARYGQGEFDSTTYSVFYLNTLATLSDYAKDPFLKTQAGMMMDWYLANTAGDWLNGIFTGAHSRDYHPTDTHNEAPAGTVAAWLYFGGRRPDLRRGEPHYSVINALSFYRPPDMLVRIAQDRSAPFEHRETHDVTSAAGNTHDNHKTNQAGGTDAGVKGYGYVSRTGVRKYSYVTKGYTLGSMVDGKRGDIVWSGQLRRWSLDWDSERPNSVLFFHHPFPDFGHQDEPYVKKWMGSSPYEQVVQHQEALIALYDIPEGETYRYAPRTPFPSDRDPYIDGFFSPEAILRLEDHEDGWIYAHGGSVLIAIRVLLPWKWLEEEEGRKRLRSEGLRNAVIVQTAKPEKFSLPSDTGIGEQERIALELDRFRQSVSRLTHINASLQEGEPPAVSYTSLSGNTLSIVYDGQRTLNGEAICYDKWPLIGNPFIFSAVGSGVLELKHRGQTLVLDYNEWLTYFRRDPEGGEQT